VECLARINVFFQTALQYDNKKLFVVDLYLYIFIIHNNVYNYSNTEYFNNIHRFMDDSFTLLKPAKINDNPNKNQTVKKDQVSNSLPKK